MDKKRYLKTLIEGIGYLKSSEIIFCWFGSIWFLPIILLAKLMKKKVIVVAGGYDVAKTGDYHHGIFDKSIVHKYLTRLLFQLSDQVLSVSEFNKNEAIKNAEIAQSKIQLLPLGFEFDLKDYSQIKRKKIVTMISNLDSMRFMIKGADLFCKLASCNPGFNFRIIGKLSNEVLHKIQKLELSNIELVGEVEFASKEFNQYLLESMYIAQFSRYESFGAAVVDGAIRGCYPLVSDQQALQELVKPDMGRVITDISQVELSDPEQNPEVISHHFNEKYALAKREQRLIEIVGAMH